MPKIPLYTAPSHTETWLKRPSGGSRAIRLVCSHVSGGTNRRIRLWRFPIFLCVSYLKLAFTLATNPTAGIRRWRITFSVPATTSTSSISPRPCRCCIARSRRSAIPSPAAAVSCSSARSGQALGAVFRQFALARRHPDQLEDGVRLDQAAAPARGNARLRRGLAIHQERGPEPAAPARQARPF